MTEYLRLGSYNVPGFGLTVSGDLEIRTEDLSGETSSTARADKGLKPKKLAVSLSIRFNNQKQLRELIQVLEARGKNGEGKVYTITNRDANVAGIRQVSVTDRVSWKPRPGQKAWDVSFTLREYLSVPERVEQRQEAAEAVTQTSDGEAVTGTDEAAAAEATAETPTPTAIPQSTLEKVLKYVDEMLA